MAGARLSSVALYILAGGTVAAVASLSTYRKSRPRNQPRTMQSVFDKPRTDE